MKKVLFIISLCVVTTAAFAQKAAVTAVERVAKNARGANINEARALIKGALENAETKDDPKTWFVAGQLEDAVVNLENTKQILGQQPNEPVMYEALNNALPFFVKAYELDQRPDAKGKVKPKYEKNIKGILSSNHIYYINGGSYYFDQKEYQKAYNCFDQYLEIANLPYMQGTKAAARDSNYMMIQFYSAVAATQMENSELAIKALTRALDTPYRQDDVYQLLCYEYEQLDDKVNLEKTLEKGMTVFPDSSFYLFNLINMYILSDRNSKAIEMLNTAIAKNPTNSQLYQALGSVYESTKQDDDKAEANHKKALELDPNTPVTHFNLGRIYYNQGVAKLNEANLINEGNLYNETKAIARSLFEKARPYCEKAHQINPTEMEYMIALRRIYYNLDLGKEFEEMDKKMENQ